MNPWISIVGTLLGAIIGPLSIYLYKRWLMPVLTPTIEPLNGSMIETPVAFPENIVEQFANGLPSPTTCMAKYARLKVCNTGRQERAIGCRGTLIGLEKIEGNERKKMPLFTDPASLIWAGVNDVKYDLPKGIPAFLALCMLNMKDNTLQLCIQPYPFMYNCLTKEDGIFFFHVMLTADNAYQPPIVVIRVTWNKQKQTLDVEMDK